MNLLKLILKFIRFFFFKFGYEVKKSDFVFLNNILNNRSIDCFLDIGAFQGDFAKNLILSGFKGHVISFEPVSENYNKLQFKAQKFKNWEVYKRIGLGDKREVLKINVSENLQSSSFLSNNSNHVELLNESKYKYTEDCEIILLDDLYDKLNLNYKNIFLKIDAQGFETKIINGGPKIINMCKGIICEVNNEILYENDIHWKEMIRILEDQNFKLHSIRDAYTDTKSGKTIQFDVIFVR
jgi:FkbM family methyltransferase